MLFVYKLDPKMLTEHVKNFRFFERFPQEIIAAYPASEPYVVGFMETMNSARVWLDTRITEAMLWLDNIAESAGGNVE